MLDLEKMWKCAKTEAEWLKYYRLLSETCPDIYKMIVRDVKLEEIFE